MPVPDVSYKVEIAWTSTWLTSAGARVWTDISSYVELQHGMKIDYGRSDEHTTADANTLTLTLDNKDGRFTWGNAASPYYPNVKLGKPIRVTATVGGVDYVRFVGLVNEWPVEWPGDSPTFATATVTASSRLSRLGVTAPLVTTVDQAIRGATSSSLSYYWPLTEATGSQFGAEQISEFRPRLNASDNGVVFGVGAEDDATETLGDGRAAVKLMAGFPVWYSRSRLAAGLLPQPVFMLDNSGAGCSVGFFLKVLNPAAGDTWGPERLLVFADATNNHSIEFGMTAATVKVAGVTSTIAYGVDLAADGNAHHVGLTMAGVGVGTGLQTARVYIDGVLVGSVGTTGLISWGELSELTLSRPNHPAAARDVLVGRLAIWGSPLTAPQISGVADSLLTGFAGETTDTRLKRYAAWARIPSTEVLTTASPVALAAVQTEAAKVEALMRQVETSEAGVLYDDRTGNLVLKPRSFRYATAVALTVAFTSDTVKGYAPKVDRSGLANVATGTGPDGNEIAYESASSRAANGDAEYTVETSALDSDEPLQLVAWQVNKNAEPRPRVPAPEFSVIDFIGGAISALLGLDVGSKMRLTNAPAQAPNAASSDFFVEGYAEEMGVGTWSISPNLTPVTLEDSVWILDDPARGVLDAGNVLAI